MTNQDPAAALHILLQFGVSMLRAGNTAARTKACLCILARRLHSPGMACSITSDALTVSIEGAAGPLTQVQEIGPSVIDAEHIRRLEELASQAGMGAAQLSRRVVDLANVTRHFTPPQVLAALAMASGAFAFLNGAGWPEMSAAAVSGAFGQKLRTSLAKRTSHFAVATLCAAAAAGMYALVAEAASRTGFAFPRYPAGLIASVLFLVPGYPLVGGLFDLLNGQTLAGLGRLAQGTMVLLVVGFGLCLVIAVGDFDISARPPPDLATEWLVGFRALASLIASCAFAMLFNNAPRVALIIGLVALAANSLRFILQDAGLASSAASLVGASFIGLVAVIMDARWSMPPAIIAAPAIIIMVPGRLAFETLVWLARGQMLEATQTLAACVFVLGALAMGLTAARILGFVVPTR